MRAARMMDEVALTEMDRRILDSYASTLDGLADYLGDGYEFVLHSLEDLDHSVIKIINGHHTGRKKGAPITDLALNMLTAIQAQKGGEYISYHTRNRQEVPLKASTIVIRGEGDRIIALLCINFYLDTPLSSLVSSLLPPAAEHSPPVNEYFADSTAELMGNSVSDAIAQVDADPSVIPSLRNKRIICLLQEWGIFRLKGSVEEVAKQLYISPNTVYMHLRKRNQR